MLASIALVFVELTMCARHWLRARRLHAERAFYSQIGRISTDP